MKKDFLEGLGLTSEQIEAVLHEQTKQEQYRWLLCDMGVNSKYWDLICNATDFSAVELTDDGKTFKDIGHLAEQIKEDWGAFMFGTTKQDAKPKAVERPSQSWETRAQEIAHKYHERRY